MASTQKKTGGSRAKSSSGGKRTAASSRAKSGSRKSQPASKSRPFRRELGGVVCFLLAIFTAFGYFNTEGIFIHWFCNLVKGLLGYGFWLTPPALLLGAYILAFHRGRPVRLRLVCALLLPLIFSCLVHGLLVDPLPWDTKLWGTLVASGMELKSGGSLGGVIAQGFVALFTPIGATILFVLVGLVVGLAAFHRTVGDVVRWVTDRPEYDYEPEPEPAPRRSRREEVREEAPAPKTARAPIDIPVDDGPLVGQEPRKEEKRGFFNRTPRVPAPDLLLQPKVKQEQPPQPASQPEQPEHLPEAPQPIPVVPPVTAPPPGEPKVPSAPLREEPAVIAPSVEAPAPAVQPELEKVTKEEARAQAAQVAQDIRQTMEQGAAPYQYPPLSLLQEGSGEIGGEALGELNSNRQRLSDTIRSFGIEANIVNVVRGPSVTRYELELDQGVRLNKLTNLADDIALALGATGVRIAPIPDKISVVGIEVPNKVVSPVSIHAVIGSNAFTSSKSKISFAVGKDISGQAIVGDIGKLPHLLIAGVPTP